MHLTIKMSRCHDFCDGKTIFLHLYASVRELLNYCVSHSRLSRHIWVLLFVNFRIYWCFTFDNILFPGCINDKPTTTYVSAIILLILILIMCLGGNWSDTPKRLLCAWIQLDLIWPHATPKGNQGLGNFHLPSIDCGSCRDMEKPIPLLPFIGPIKYSSCPNGERSFSMSPLQANCGVPGWDLAQLSPGTIQTLQL